MKKFTQFFFMAIAFLLISNIFFAQQSTNKITSVVGKLVRVTPNLTDIDPTTMYGEPLKITRDMNGIIGISEKGEEKIEEKIKGQSKHFADYVLRNNFNTPPLNTPVTAISKSFEGQTWTNFDPSDNNIAVGPSHIIQMINDPQGSKLQVWNKSGTVIQAPITLASITGIVGSGDPIVMYDQLADRWVLTEFGPSTCCNSLIIAVSVTNNPTGSWKIYQYTDASFFPDYPKYSVWNNTAYFARTSDFNAAGTSYLGGSIYAFDRQAMLAGAATATMVRVRMLDAGAISYYYMNTIGLDGATPSTQSGLFAVPDQTNSKINIFEFTPNFTTPASSVVGALVPITINSFNNPSSSIKQPDGTNIETLGYRLMYRLSYRNNGGTESILISHTVRGATTTTTDVRWYELRRNAGNWTLYQQGNITGADGQSRFMPGISQDALGNIAVMYNLSGTSIYPSIKYTARNVCDPLGQMTLPEQTIINGTVAHAPGFYASPFRWGDYNTLIADPTINGSFWGTSEYGGVPSVGTSGNDTRIVNFAITAGAPTFATQPTSSTVCAGISASFSVLANGIAPITYQWQRSNDNGVTWNNIVGATAANYSFTTAFTDNNSQYRSIASRSCGTPGTSNVAILTTLPAPNAPNITINGSTSICTGQTAILNSNLGINNALTFTQASSQYITVPHSASINLGASFTIEVWVKYSGLNSTIVDKGDYNFLFQVGANSNANKLGFFNKNTNVWNYATGTVPTNTWTHVAVTLSAGTLTFYINGIASGTAAVTFTQDLNAMNIGRQQPISGGCNCNYFNGTMDELRIWNIAKTQANIQTNMNNSVASNSTGLVAYYKFNEGTGLNTFDATANANNGTLVNTPLWQVPSTSPVNAVVWTPGSATTPIINVNTSGNYIATVTNGYGCTSSATVAIIANNTPPPALGTDVTLYKSCFGDVTNLTSLFTTTGLTATWNTANTTSASPGTYQLIATNAVGCTDTAIANVILEVATWTGAISSDWHTAGNWNINKVPTALTQVIIPFGTINPCIISTQNAVAASLQVRSGTNVTTTNNKQLSINGKCLTLPPN